MTPWVLDVLHDFGMGFPCQDLGISGVDCNKMLGAKVAFTIPLGNPWDRAGLVFHILGRMGIEGHYIVEFSCGTTTAKASQPV